MDNRDDDAFEFHVHNLSKAYSEVGCYFVDCNSI